MRHFLYHVLIFCIASIFISCTSQSSLIRKADNYVKIGEYANASSIYKKVYNGIPYKNRILKGEVSLKLAQTYMSYGNVARAIVSFKNALRFGVPDSIIGMDYALALKKMGDYKGAEKEFSRLLNSDSLFVLKFGALSHEIQSCREAVRGKGETTDYSIKLSNIFNSNRSDYCPVLLPPDYTQLYYSSTNTQSTGVVSGITSMKSGDIFFSKLDQKGKWSKGEKINNINTKDDEGACCFSPDGKVMFFTLCREDAQYPRFAEIWFSQRSDANWSKPQRLEITADTLSSFAYPALDPQGKYLYFSSDMPGGYGSFDLWKVPIDGTRIIGPIENLGKEINTLKDEMFPYFRGNGDFYFSSNGHYPNYGGLDLYYIKNYVSMNAYGSDSLQFMNMMHKVLKDEKDKAMIVHHMPYPMNSNGDDFGITFFKNKNSGFFSSSRITNGRGWDKIFSFTYPDIVLNVEGWVYEQDGYELPKSQVYIVGSNGFYEKLNVLANGSFKVNLKPGINYVFLATCDGYLNVERQIKLDTLTNLTKPLNYTLQFPLPNINLPVLVKGIFYKFDKAEISDSSKSALQNLVTLLNENPNITIELSSHCDYRGEEKYNLELSKERAVNVVKYLVGAGIDQHRLIAKGYGESQPIIVTKKIHESYPFLITGDTLNLKTITRLTEKEQEIANALNRRTEFKVLSTTYGLFDKKGNLKYKIIEQKDKIQDTYIKKDDEYEY